MLFRSELRELLRTLKIPSVQAAVGSLEAHAAEPEYLTESTWPSG